MPTRPAWHFKLVQPGDTNRNPIQGEFFATEATSDAGDALVREAIQNSLDAGTPGATVLVRFYLSESKCLPAQVVEKLLYGGDAHFRAKGNGLQDPVQAGEPCCFLTVEDFNTTGLMGNPRQWYQIADTRNAFFSFFRSEGLSDKEQEERGRWGVGKFVFPRSSRMSAFFGLTITHHGTGPLLMGRAVLKSHDVNGDRYVSDGYFGEVAAEPRGLILPITDGDYIEAFAKDFRLSRRSEPGLSVVVPWADPEIKADDIARSVVRGYFQPILEGKLKVVVETPHAKVVLDADALKRALAHNDQRFGGDILPFIDLAEWARGVRGNSHVHLAIPSASEPPRWTTERFPPDVANTLREVMDADAGQRAAVRVPLWVQRKGGEPQAAEFDVYLERDGTYESGKPCFIRDGIIILDVRARKSRGIRSLVVVRGGPLATMLGDSENPAHTQWQKGSSHFRDRYERGPSTLDFVINAVSSIVRIITESETAEDERALLSFFYLPPSDVNDGMRQRAPRASRKGDKPPPPPPPPPPPEPQPFRVSRVQGGFTVTPAEAGATPPPFLEVAMAYHTRQGNPFAGYDRADFVVERSPIHIEQRGLEFLRRKDNRLLAAIRDRDFHLLVTGFDVKRDLRIRVQAKENVNVANS
jgi:hypothetical protein